MNSLRKSNLLMQLEAVFIFAIRKLTIYKNSVFSCQVKF